MSKVLVIDNYDSFTYNLVNYLERAGADSVMAVRNDKITIEEIVKMKISHIVLSPGPGTPDGAGISLEVIKNFSGTIPIFGVCLGMQCIAQAFGGTIIHAKKVMHGKPDTVIHNGKGIFRSFMSSFSIMRYHSLSVDGNAVPIELEISAKSQDEEIMGLRHKVHNTEGVQFHPESIATENGIDIIKNFLYTNRSDITIRDCITDLIHQKTLSYDKACFVADEISNGVLSDIQITSLLMSITARGISEDELFGFAHTMFKKARAFVLPPTVAEKTLDIVGTGGDGLRTLNISTISSIVVASLGQKVLKHGNRAVSSSSGSSNVLDVLQYPLNLDIKETTDVFTKTNFAFLLAPLYHSSFKHLVSVRKKIGVPTIINFLGPLINPANIGLQLLGVSEKYMCVPMLRAAYRLGRKRVWVVRADDVMDEVSVCAPTTIYALENDKYKTDKTDKVVTHTFSASDIGLKNHDISSLVVKDAAHSAQLAKSVMQGKSQGKINAAIIDVIAANAGVALTLGAGASFKDIPMFVEKVKTHLLSAKVWDYFSNVVSYGHNIKKT